MTRRPATRPVAFLGYAFLAIVGVAACAESPTGPAASPRATLAATVEGSQARTAPDGGAYCPYYDDDPTRVCILVSRKYYPDGVTICNYYCLDGKKKRVTPS